MAKRKQMYLIVHHIQVGDEVVIAGYLNEGEAEAHAKRLCDREGSQNYSVLPLYEGEER